MEYIYKIKNGLICRAYIKVNSCESIGLGASFELYKMLIQHLEHNKKFKQKLLKLFLAEFSS